jgi:hypothetical protein
MVEPCSPIVVGVSATVVVVTTVVGVGTVVVVVSGAVEIVTLPVVGGVVSGVVVGGAVVGAVVVGPVVGVVVVGAVVGGAVVGGTVTVVVVGGAVVGGVVVVVELLEPMHGPISDTEVDSVRVNPSFHRDATVSVTLPVVGPGTMVVADVGMPGWTVEL